MLTRPSVPAVVFVTPLLLFSSLAVTAGAQLASVPASVETAPVPSAGDAADDMAVWVHPSDPNLSRVIGSDKQGGLAVYDLAGNQLQYLADGNLNNVDIRYGFPLGGTEVALVTSAERSQDRLAIYAVNPVTTLLEDVTAAPIQLLFDVYGCCMYRSAVTGEFYFIATSEDGEVEQWRLFDTGLGTVGATHVRSLTLSSKCEGCVADDELGYLFIAEEEVGLWRYGAEPTDMTAPLFVDASAGGGQLAADVEGLAIYYAHGGQGYLLASSQGNDTFVAYDRAPPHAPRHIFGIAANAGAGIDAVSGTDGIDVVNLGLGGAFPDGVFLAQDDENTGANQNFKLVSWSDVALSASPPLLVDSTYDAFGALDDTWVDLGGGTVGINGAPTLIGAGTLVGGTQVSLDLTQAPPAALMLLWTSITSVPFNALGGTLHATPFLEQYVLGSDLAGELALSTFWPVFVPSGTEVWFQFIIQDVSVPFGITISNGLKATTP